MPKREPVATQGGRRKRDLVHEIAQTGANYLRLKADEKHLKGEISKENAKIKDTLKKHPEILETNGNHKEIYAPLGDGENEIFIQIQKAESVRMVDNIIDLVKQKLGSKADNFIMVQEVLHDKALEAMLNQGLITAEDLLEWTETKETERLIVKATKKK